MKFIIYFIPIVWGSGGGGEGGEQAFQAKGNPAG